MGLDFASFLEKFQSFCGKKFTDPEFGIKFKGQVTEEFIYEAKSNYTPETMEHFEKRFETVKSAALAKSPRFEFIPLKHQV